MVLLLEYQNWENYIKLHILQKLIAVTLLLSNKNKHYYTKGAMQCS